MHPLDAATALEKSGENFRGATSDAYWNFTGPFGGATAATLLHAAVDHPETAEPAAFHDHQLLRAGR